VLKIPIANKELLLYISISEDVVGKALVQEEEDGQQLIYFVS